MNLKYQNGESSHEAQNRIVEVVNRLLTSDTEHAIIVAHGGIISLLLHYYDQSFGFEQWKNISRPDVYLLGYSPNETLIRRVWKETKG